MKLRTRAQEREARGRIGEGGGEAKKHKKSHNSLDAMWEKGETGARREKRRQDSFGSVATDSDSLENSKEARREVQDPWGLNKNYTSRESVSCFSRLVKGFRNKCP